ncbi:MAG: dihydrofolate reductase family protein [Gemmatimonadota bacterium]
MSPRRSIIIQIATSPDMFIARPDGDFEWLNSFPGTVDYGMKSFYATIDTVLYGRKTYDAALAYNEKHGIEGGVVDPKLDNYVFSRLPAARTATGVTFLSAPVKEFAARMRSAPGKHIWMMGGGELIASFLDAGEIDASDVHVFPIFIGEGIPLVAPRHRSLLRRTRSVKKYFDGVVRMRYEIPSA